MKDIHSIGQAFKIVSGRTAKGEVDSEGSNLSEVSVRDTKPIASQESSPQETDLVRWYHIEMHLDKEQIEELKKHLRKKYGHFLIKLSEGEKK